MKPFLIHKETIINIIGIILFKLILDFSYIDFVVPYYGYMGFDIYFDLFTYLEGWFWTLIPFLLLLRHKEHNLYSILLLSFLLLLVPTTTLYAFNNEPAVSFYSMVLPYTAMLLALSTKRVRIYYFPYGKKLAIGIALFMVMIVLAHYILTVGLGHINFNLSKVYELRKSEYGLASNAGLYGYFNPWVTKVFNLFLISVALLRKKYLFALLFVAIQILLFGLSGHKSVLFSLLLLGGLYLFDKFKHQTAIIIYSLTALIGIVLIYFYLFSNPILPSILIRRVFFVPTLLNYVYMDYFTAHDFLYWSNSLLKNIFLYPYNVSPVFVIGAYLDRPDMAANTGLFGSGYMQLGIFGIILYTFIVTVLINLIQQFQQLPKWMINAIVLMPMLSLFISSDLPTALLTHGLLIAVVILYLYSTPEKIQK